MPHLEAHADIYTILAAPESSMNMPPLSNAMKQAISDVTKALGGTSNTKEHHATNYSKALKGVAQMKEIADSEGNEAVSERVDAVKSFVLALSNVGARSGREFKSHGYGHSDIGELGVAPMENYLR